MCLEIIKDILAEVDDLMISDLEEAGNLLRASLSEERVTVFNKFEAGHLERTREIAKRALLAGVAMGRGLGAYFPESGDF